MKAQILQLKWPNQRLQGSKPLRRQFEKHSLEDIVKTDVGDLSGIDLLQVIGMTFRVVSGRSGAEGRPEVKIVSSGDSNVLRFMCWSRPETHIDIGKEAIRASYLFLFN